MEVNEFADRLDDMVTAMNAVADDLSLAAAC